MKKMTTSDRVVFKDALDYCLCHNSDAVLMRAVLIGDLEVSLWIFQSDDGADEGIAVKLRYRGVLGRPEEPWRESDMKAIADGLAWAMSEVTDRSTRRRWSPPRFL